VCVCVCVCVGGCHIHCGRNPRNGGSPPKDNSDVNIMNFISVVSLFVIMVWLMKDVPDSLITDTTVSVSVEYNTKCTIHKYSPVYFVIVDYCWYYRLWDG
jgi:hypothetical protein